MHSTLPPPLVVHVAPALREGVFGVCVIDPSSPEARGGQLLVTAPTLRALPAAIETAIARLDRASGESPADPSDA